MLENEIKALEAAIIAMPAENCGALLNLLIDEKEKYVRARARAADSAARECVFVCRRHTYKNTKRNQKKKLRGQSDFFKSMWLMGILVVAFFKKSDWSYL
jgi:hypothetical protein